ncbi:Glutamate decarboxylase 3 [Turnera subulata]|uniref:Glutamate decarboxylase 3 n=1 Tax=Turnera subulata TaxID=218843 RepID=A0A9Q0IZ54_9ROSI|nr:Glutamate decarboxylase 3 [Turnera subulata]
MDIRAKLTRLNNPLEETGRFKITSNEVGVPLVASSLKDDSCHDEFEIAEMLRRFGWIVPAYTMPADARHITVLRVVIAERLVLDITKVLHDLDALPPSHKHQQTPAPKKTDLEIQRETVAYWKNFVLSNNAAAANKNKIC